MIAPIENSEIELVRGGCVEVPEKTDSGNTIGRIAQKILDDLLKPVTKPKLDN